MTVDEAKSNQNMVNSLFDTFKKIVQPYLLTADQIEVIEDAKWSISGEFDAEIYHAINMDRIAG